MTSAEYANLSWFGRLRDHDQEIELVRRYRSDRNAALAVARWDYHVGRHQEGQGRFRIHPARSSAILHSLGRRQLRMVELSRWRALAPGACAAANSDRDTLRGEGRRTTAGGGFWLTVGCLDHDCWPYSPVRLPWLDGREIRLYPAISAHGGLYPKVYILQGDRPLCTTIRWRRFSLSISCSGLAEAGGQPQQKVPPAGISTSAAAETLWRRSIRTSSDDVSGRN
jgi:hypothetical protein